MKVDNYLSHSYIYERNVDRRHLLLLPRVRDGPTLRTALCHKDYAAKIINWLFATGWLQEYRLAKRLKEEEGSEEKNSSFSRPEQNGNNTEDATSTRRERRKRNRASGF